VIDFIGPETPFFPPALDPILLERLALDELVGLPCGEPFDCAGIVLEVYRRAGRPIRAPETESVLAELERAGFSFVEVGEPLRPLDVLVFARPSLDEADATTHHLGVVLEPPRFLHAIVGGGVRTDSVERTLWRRSLLGGYRLG
jgi:cell wall-associated NlpC family hydrolase